MARKRSDPLGVLVVVLGAIGLGAAAVAQAVAGMAEWLGPVEIAAGAGAILLLVILVARADAAAKQRKAEERAREIAAHRQHLLDRYKDPQAVQRIIDGVVWQGETAAQLTDSLGKPADVDEKVLKTKRKQIWKYYPDGRDRYRMRITLEDDVVVGWDQR